MFIENLISFPALERFCRRSLRRSTMTPLQLCEIFEEFPQTLFTTQAGAASSAAARPFVTAVHCSDKENILSVDVAK